MKKDKYIVVNFPCTVVFWSENRAECEEFISMNEETQLIGYYDFAIYELSTAD